MLERGKAAAEVSQDLILAVDTFGERCDRVHSNSLLWSPLLVAANTLGLVESPASLSGSRAFCP